MSDEPLTEAHSLVESDMGLILSHPELANVNALKRRASPSFEGLEDDASRKRLKEGDVISTNNESHHKVLATQDALADSLAQELNCGCCSKLCASPCRCVTLPTFLLWKASPPY